MHIEPAFRRIAPASAMPPMQCRARGSRFAMVLRHIGLVLGMLLLAAGGAITLLALYGLHALPPAEDLARAGDDMATFRCGMPAAAAIVALMFALPTAAVGGTLMAWWRPVRRWRDR